MVAAPPWMSPMIKSTAAPARFDDPRSRCRPTPRSTASTAIDAAKLKTATKFLAPMGCTILPHSSPLKSEGATVNWARVGIPTMIMAIVVVHGQRVHSQWAHPGGSECGREYDRVQGGHPVQPIPTSRDSADPVGLAVRFDACDGKRTADDRVRNRCRLRCRRRRVPERSPLTAARRQRLAME